MTPITWQAAVDDEEQRPLLQDILEAAVDDRRQLTSENSGHSCKPSSKQPLMGKASKEKASNLKILLHQSAKLLLETYCDMN